MKRRFLSVLLSLCLVLGLLPTAAFAQGKRYVALGDSITAGYGLADDEKAFPEIIAEDNGYVLTNLANSGDTSGDLLEVVTDSSNAGALSGADLITITIGGNDLMGALYEYLADAYNTENQTALTGDDVRNALTGERVDTTMLTFAADVIGDFASSDAAGEALEEFGANLNSIIAAIKSVNPDVTIIVANQYNPYRYLANEVASIPMASLTPYPAMFKNVADAFDAGLTQLNGAIGLGETMGMYSVADVYDAFNGVTENPCNASITIASPPTINLDFHPNAYGHELMAGVISELLPESEEPGGEEPGTEEPGTEEPGTEEPGTEEPGTEEPGTEEPGTEEPGTEEPGTEEPGTEEPGTEEPGTEEPGTEEPESRVEALLVNGVDILAENDHTVACGSGTAEYDPTTNVLTLRNAEIDTIGQILFYSAGICAEGDLTMFLVGDNTIAVDDETRNNIYGIWSSSSLTILSDGTGKLTVTNRTGDGIYASDSLRIEQSEVTATGFARTIYTYNNIVIDDSTVTAHSTNESGWSNGILGETITILGNSNVTAESSNEDDMGIFAYSGIFIGGVKYTSFGQTAVVQNGQPKNGLRTYGVVVNNVFLNRNQTTASFPGGGTAVYDADAATLTLSDVTVSNAYAYGANGCGIFADEDLTIVLEGNNSISGDMAYGIYGRGKLAIQGSGSLDITSGYTGIYAFYNQSDFPSIAINATLKITVTCGEEDSSYRTYSGIEGYSGIEIKGGNIEIIFQSNVSEHISTWAAGFYTESMLSISDGNVHITGSAGSISCSGILARSMTISGGTVDIDTSSGICYVTPVIITGSPTLRVKAVEDELGIYSYDITVNGVVYICDKNTVSIIQGEILDGLREKGVIINGELLIDSGTVICGDGTAVYDADTRVLTLTNATINTDLSGASCGIFAEIEDPLTIVLNGGNTITGASLTCGISGPSDLTIQGPGSLSITSSGQACITTGGILTITGGMVSAICLGENGYGILSDALTLEQGGTLYASGSRAAIQLEKEPILPNNYLPKGYYVAKVSDTMVWIGGKNPTVYTIARDGDSVSYRYDIFTDTGTLTGAAKSVLLTDYSALEDGGDTGSTTESERNPDGSLTTTVTKPDGTTVETTRYPDGSKEVVETLKDGTIVTTATDKSGNETKTTENTDGTSVIAVTRTDGSTSATTVDKEGLSVTVAALSDSAAAQTGTVYLPMPAVTAASDLKSAPAVTLDLPASTAVKVEIPVENVTAGTVAVLVKADGTSEIVRTSVATADGVVLTLSGGETVKLVDNSKTFADVAATFWGADAVAFASSRELFNGTSATDFSPNAPMDRAMIVTVLARLDGADTSTGSTWYEAGVQWAVTSGISDGSGLDQNLTREQLATMLYRYAQLKGYDVSVGNNTNILSYADASSVSSYAMEAMQWACGAGIIGGKDGLLAPAGSATRAEVATMLMRFVAGL